MKPGIAVVSEQFSNVNTGIVYLMGDSEAKKPIGTVEEWLTDIEEERLAMVNTTPDEDSGPCGTRPRIHPWT